MTIKDDNNYRRTDRQLTPPTQEGQWFYLPQHYFKDGNYWDWRPEQYIWIIK